MTPYILVVLWVCKTVQLEEELKNLEDCKVGKIKIWALQNLELIYKILVVKIIEVWSNLKYF